MITKSFPPPAILENVNGSCCTIGIFVRSEGLNPPVRILARNPHARNEGGRWTVHNRRRKPLENRSNCRRRSFVRSGRRRTTASTAAVIRASEADRDHRHSRHQRRRRGDGQEGEFGHRPDERRLPVVRERRPEKHLQFLRSRRQKG